METKEIFNAMKVVSWIIFIGLSIEAGAIIISFFVSLFINSEGANNLYLGLDLSNLYEVNRWYFITITSFLIASALLKAYLFYLVIKIFTEINFDHPFNKNITSLIAKISHISFGIGIVGVIAGAYNKWLMHRGFTDQLNWETAAYLFMAGIIYIIALLFKRAIEIQSENELTI